MPALIAGVFKKRHEAEIAQGDEQAFGLAAETIAQRLGKGGLTTCFFQGPFINIEIDRAECTSAIEANWVNADGIGTKQMIANDGRRERLMHGAVAAFAAGLNPLAGMDIFTA